MGCTIWGQIVTSSLWLKVCGCGWNCLLSHLFHSNRSPRITTSLPFWWGFFWALNIGVLYTGFFEVSLKDSWPESVTLSLSLPPSFCLECRCKGWSFSHHLGPWGVAEQWVRRSMALQAFHETASHFHPCIACLWIFLQARISFLI